MPTQHQIRMTKDGSPTLFHTHYNQTYHSVNGALSESQHVFIRAGLAEAARRKSQIVLFEVGFGTGLNALLAYSFAISNKLHIQYLCLEPFPVPHNQLLAFSRQLQLPADLQQVFLRLHAAKNIPVSLGDRFTFTCYEKSLQNYHDRPGTDIVFYDAFSPAVQPEMWTEQALQCVSDMMNGDALLVTYCAKGAVKRILSQLNFVVESLPGANGKREMIRATKKQHP